MSGEHPFILLAVENVRFVCDGRLHPCLVIWHQVTRFCIFVFLFPGMFGYDNLAGREHLYVQIFPAPRGIEKCAIPLLMPLIASLGLGTAGALSRQQAQQWLYDSYKNLGCQITQGLFTLEGSIARLED